MSEHDFISLSEARAQVAAEVPVLAPVRLPLAQLVGRVAAQEARARVASPSVTGATKDGYALRAREAAAASPERPVALRVVGAVAAGEQTAVAVEPGTTVQVTTGAPLPAGADAVVPWELTRRQGDTILVLAPTEPGRNLLPAGSDVSPGQVVARPGRVLTPAAVGLLAAAGLEELAVYPLPRVGLLATGREVVAPGRPLPRGAVYASNLVQTGAWLSLHGMEVLTRVTDDDAGRIRSAAAGLLADCDALLTSGGAWTSRRDLVVGTLKDLGLELAFRRVRMGPGKGVAFGLLGGKPVFCLPGGPPSHEMAFLQLALPGLLRMAGHREPGLPLVAARLEEPLRGQADWTQLWRGGFRPAEEPGRPPWFRAHPLRDRLQSMAAAEGIVMLPEGREHIPAGEVVMVQRLLPACPFPPRP